MSSLSDKLKSLGVQVGAENLRPVSPTQPASQRSLTAALDEILAGHTLENTQGETYVIEKQYPLNYQQGQVSLLGGRPLQVLAAWAGNLHLADLSTQEFAFLDTETTGLSGGTGTYAFLVGVGRIEADTFHLVQFFMRDPAEEPALLLALEEFLAPCQALVTFNGKTFDAPLLNTRYLVQGWQSPLIELNHVDLLHLARRLWRERLPSRTLGNLEVQILGSERTEEDIPGWMIPQIYIDYLRSGDPAPLKNVFYHNANDVVSMVALFNHMAGLLADPSQAAIEHGVDLISLARLYEDLGDSDRAIELYLQGLGYEDAPDSPVDPQFRLTHSVFMDALERLARLHKRRQDFTTAISLWEKAARFNSFPAYLELAKYYEHRQGDYQLALDWCRSALEWINRSDSSHFERQQWLEDLEKRIDRLQRKLAKTRLE
jgi:hypothetical protein